MEKRFVFCGCQYPGTSSGATGGRGGKKSGWEWDIPTPNRKKRKQISQSNPVLANKYNKAHDMESINKRLRYNFLLLLPISSFCN